MIKITFFFLFLSDQNNLILKNQTIQIKLYGFVFLKKCWFSLFSWFFRKKIISFLSMEFCMVHWFEGSTNDLVSDNIYFYIYIYIYIFFLFLLLLFPIYFHLVHCYCPYLGYLNEFRQFYIIWTIPIFLEIFFLGLLLLNNISLRFIFSLVGF